MRNYQSYEDFAVSGANLHPRGYLVEAFQGQEIVGWYGSIERQLTRMLEENEASNNYVYADKLRQFIKTWRENEITGSLNRDVILVLKSATEQLAVDAWNLSNYFSNLRDQLRKLLASEEQLPRGDSGLDDKMGGPGGGAPGGAMPSLSPEFGPEEGAPSDLSGDVQFGDELGAEGGPGASPDDLAAPEGEELLPGEAPTPEEEEEMKKSAPPGRKMAPPPRSNA